MNAIRFQYPDYENPAVNTEAGEKRKRVAKSIRKTSKNTTDADTERMSQRAMKSHLQAPKRRKPRLQKNLPLRKGKRRSATTTSSWAIIYHNSFIDDVTSTQRSEGMNNVFKKHFFRKLGLSKLLVECEKVSTGLRENEVNADFRSCQKIPVTYNPNSLMLKTTVESCTRRMFTKFETKFKHNFFY